VKQKRKTERESRPNAVAANGLQPTVFERAMDVATSLRQVMEVEPLPFWKRCKAEPGWGHNISIRLRNTIFKSIEKLRPNGKVNWRNYGRCIGILERYNTFRKHDVPRLLENALDGLTEDQWRKLQPQLGGEQARQYYLKILGRPADDKATLDEVWELVDKRESEHLYKIRQTACLLVAQQNAKDASQFWKGVVEGYSLFLDPDGEFSGDHRRTNVYFELLSMQYEVEKMRRKLPAISRTGLRSELKKSPSFEDPGQARFNDLCDEIMLSMKGPGPAHKLVAR
jgi:hypothetical protein